MANQFEIRDNCGFLDGRDIAGAQITPHEFDVIDKSTGEKVGSVTAWDSNQAGEKIANGDWKQDKD